MSTMPRDSPDHRFRRQQFHLPGSSPLARANSCEREIGRNATTLSTPKKTPKKTKTPVETARRQLKKNKDKQPTAETSPAPASNAASASSPATAPKVPKVPKVPKAPKNTTKKSKTSLFTAPKKKETCEEPGKAKLPVPEFEAWLRDAFWKIGTLTGVAVAAETDYYEVNCDRGGGEAARCRDRRRGRFSTFPSLFDAGDVRGRAS